MEKFKIKVGRVALIKHKAVIMEYFYPTVPGSGDGETQTMYLTDEEWKEWSEQQIPKHKRYELVSHEDIDVSAYAWADGEDVSNEADPVLTANEMMKYTSREEYEASLPENQAAYQIDTDYRISKLELGI